MYCNRLSTIFQARHRTKNMLQSPLLALC
jgi:hypothetical protein